jgi:hypothetical protein
MPRNIELFSSHSALKVVGKYYEQNQFGQKTNCVSVSFSSESVKFGTMSLDNQIIMSGNQSLDYCIQWTKRATRTVT